MAKLVFAVTANGTAWLTLATGLVIFAAAFILLTVLAPGFVPALTASLPGTGLNALAAAVIALFATSLSGAALARRQAREVAQVRTAIDSMAQGMCMFDAAERLVVCNAQYYGMYGLTSDEVSPGAKLTEVLERRVA